MPQALKSLLLRYGLPMDRIAPTRRPKERAIGYQSWCELLFLHWSFDPAALQGLLPSGLTVDTFDGHAYVGLVPFAMRQVRPRPIPGFLGFNFLESNVRTYVHREGRDPGVYFFSLDAASRIAVAIARWRWSLAYFNARMRFTIEADERRRYSAQRLGAASPKMEIVYRPGEPMGSAEPGTLDHFLLERYLLYVEHRGALHRGQVHHSPYPAHTATLEHLEDGFVSAAGFSSNRPPELVHYAPGVDVEIYPLRRL